jgi:putative DNA modification/repair radical SAM protein
MELKEKLRILADSAKYDASCSSSGSDRKNIGKGLGNASMAGICHSWSDDGRCVSLLKILFSNCCIYDCTYCINRTSNDVERATFTPEEVVDLTVNFYRRNYIEGLFLSSAVIKNPNYTMELLIKTVKKLRLENHFNGYIHMKAIPGADSLLIQEAGKFVDRMSVNIELPSSTSLKLLAPQKNKEAILTPMGLMKTKIEQGKEERKLFREAPLFVPAGQTTQLIVGATPDHDVNILRLSENLYKHFKLKRVYYSAYIPVLNHPNLPVISKPPLLREHRLYQADWLLRFYGFKADELLDDRNYDFDLELDPKSNWALNNINQFPIEINRAAYELIVRVPGIGVKSAMKIIEARRSQILTFDGLKKIGVVLKRAKHFVTCNGKFYGDNLDNYSLIKSHLITGKKPKPDKTFGGNQLSLFSYTDNLLLSSSSDIYSKLSGEL